MKHSFTFWTALVLLFQTGALKAYEVWEEEIEIVLQELSSEMTLRDITYKTELFVLAQSLQRANEDLRSTTSTDLKVNLLIKVYELREEVAQIDALYISDIAKIRYLKGLQIIKILYEKTLALDHHFATVNTLSEINKMSNPNQYEDFRDIKVLLENKRDKKIGFELSSLLGNNIYTSVVHSIVSLFSNSQASKVEKETSLKNVECILDFTLRMHEDLNTIYFETAYLQKSNESILVELEQLFKDYTQPIKYQTLLKECRENDEWSMLSDNLNRYLETLNATIQSGGQTSRVRTLQINLQFPIDRLLQFITQYNAFIDQGSKFYEKFGIMLNSYENEQQCANKIPVEYKTLKNNISLSITKFNTAYKPIEINGSKLKQLLYGISEYD